MDTNEPVQSPCSQPGQVLDGSFASLLAGGVMDYRIYLPPCYGLDGRFYPVLYLLHGNATDSGHWIDLGLEEAADTIFRGRISPPMLVVMPSGNPLAQNTSGGPYSFEGAVVNELIPSIEAGYCAWPDSKARAIGGLSRGGYWALEIAFRHPEKFASVGGHSAALVDTYAGPDLNPQYTGLTRDLGDLRVYLDIGRNDWYLANLQRLHAEMEGAGVAHTWVLNEGGHADDYWSSHLEEYLTWYAAAWPAERTAYPPCSVEAPPG